MNENLTENIKKLVQKGKENGFILISELNAIIENLKLADQQYIRDGMEFKYMTGEEAIEFLQSLSDGKTKAFVKDEEEKK